MEPLCSERFWTAVLIFASVILVAVWKILVFWPGQGLASYLKRRKPQRYWVLFAISSAALVFWLYLIYQITGKIPWR